MSEKLYMQKALQQGKEAFDEDEVPVGALIVYQNKIIAQAHNQVELLNDPTAHAEMIAITQATNYLQSKWLEGCSLYVTVEPCSMCAGALILARIDRVVFGVADLKTGAFGSTMDINSLGLNHTIEIEKGITEEEAGLLMQKFFQAKRKPR